MSLSIIARSERLVNPRKCRIVRGRVSPGPLGSPGRGENGRAACLGRRRNQPRLWDKDDAMGFGHFSAGGREYVITRFVAPRSWENYLSNRAM